MPAGDGTVPHAVLSLDPEKAIDLIVWDHLFDTLQKFGTPPKLVTALRTLYSGSPSQILSNNYISSPFPILQGTRQGCSLSPLLFAIVIEHLPIALRDSAAFQGLSLGDQVLK